MRGLVTIIFILSTSAWAYSQGQSAASIDRVTKIARALKPGMPVDKVIPLVTEAARLCGFVIWDEDRNVLLQPAGDARLKLALTDTEIQLYSQMFSQGQGTGIAEIASAYAHILEQDNVQEAIQEMVIGGLNDLATDEQVSHQILFAFISSQANAQGDTPGYFEDETQLNAIQSLFIWRIIGEDALYASRKSGIVTRQVLGKPQIRFVSLKPTPYFEAPGWAEDGYAGVMTTVVSTVVDFFGAEGVNKSLGKLNLLSSIVKFIATYACLKGEVSVDAPGSPLVRKITTATGEQRTLAAKFVIDGTKATDFLKKNRKYFLQMGLDVDMPKSGPIAGIETNWEIGQSQKSSKNHLIQTVGQDQIDKVVTDDNGIARITVEGVARPQALDPKTVSPVIKIVGILVTPQVKSTEIKQDMVDAVFGAFGIKDGPTGLLTPIMETLYRLKWKGSQYFPLPVRDWEAGGTVASLTVTIQGSGRELIKGERLWYGTINRSFDFERMPVLFQGAALMPKLDPNVLKNLPPLQRQQMEEGFKNMEKAARMRTYQAIGPGNLTWKVQDTSNLIVIAGCIYYYDKDNFKVDGSGVMSLPGPKGKNSEAHFLINVDEQAATATISVAKVFDVIRSWVKIESGKKTTGSNENTMFMQSELTFVDPPKKLFVLPLKKTDEDGSTGANYYGSESFPFTFGMNGRGSGTMIVSYAISRVRQPK